MKGDKHTNTQTYGRTSRLLDRIGPMGRFGENSLKWYNRPALLSGHFQPMLRSVFWVPISQYPPLSHQCQTRAKCIVHPPVVSPLTAHCFLDGCSGPQPRHCSTTSCISSHSQSKGIVLVVLTVDIQKLEPLGSSQGKTLLCNSVLLACTKC